MWILIVLEYFKITKLPTLVTSFSIAILLTGSIICRLGINIFWYAEKFIDNSISTLSLLVGFTVAIFTLLISANNSNIEEIKFQYLKNVTLYGSEVSLYKSLLIKMSYLIFIESLLLLFNLLYPFFFSHQCPTYAGIVGLYFSIFILIHIITSNISNILDFYFILTKK